MCTAGEYFPIFRCNGGQILVKDSAANIMKTQAVRQTDGETWRIQ